MRARPRPRGARHTPGHRRAAAAAAASPPGEIAPSQLERFFAAHEFNCRHVAAASDVQPLALAELLALSDPDSRARYENLSLAYVDPAGSPALRHAVATSLGHGPHATAGDVCIGAPQELAYLLTRALSLTPGDRVVAPAPVYEGLTAVAAAAGCDLVRWEPRGGEGGRPTYDPADLPSLLGPSARLLILNFPHAPTGATLTRDGLDAALRAGERAGAVVLSDEMYGPLARAPLPTAVAAAALLGVTTPVVSLGGLSKWAGCPGLRIGWLVFGRGGAGGAALAARVKELRDYTTVCPPAVSDALALAAVRAAPLLAARGRSLVAAGAESVAAFAAAHASYVQAVPGDAGSTRLLRLVTGEAPAAFCARAVREAGVLLLPASAYPGLPSSLADTVRVGLGRTDLPAALERVGGLLAGSPMRGAG